MKPCPFCKEEIHDEALKCKHCGSMLGGSSDSKMPLPAELNRWNWASFLWGPIWGIGHNVMYGLACLIPYFGFIMLFIMGANGNRWAWERNRYDGVEQYLAKQRKWVRAWLMIFGGLFGLAMVMALLMPLLVRH